MYSVAPQGDRKFGSTIFIEILRKNEEQLEIRAACASEGSVAGLVESATPLNCDKIFSGGASGAGSCNLTRAQTAESKIRNVHLLKSQIEIGAQSDRNRFAD